MFCCKRSIIPFAYTFPLDDFANFYAYTCAVMTLKRALKAYISFLAASVYLFLRYHSLVNFCFAYAVLLRRILMSCNC